MGFYCILLCESSENMDEKIVLDFNTIAIECRLLEDIETNTIIAKIDELEQKHSRQNLISIYNHFLSISKNSDVLIYLVKCSDKYRDKSSLSPILDLLLNQENDINLRAMCAKAVSNLKDTSAVTSLLYCLNNKDENYKIRLACADALGRIGDRYAVTPLINVVQDEEEKSVYVRESAAVALGMLGDIRAVDPLVAILETKKGFLDKFTFLKERVIEALGKLNLNNDRVFKALQHALNDESSCIRINAIEALMESEDDRAYPLIKNMLGDLNEEVKKNALIACYNIVGRDILDEVISGKEYCDFLKAEAESMIREYEEEDIDGA